MNDPIYVEIAKVMGMQIASEQDTGKAIQNAFRKLTGRFPKDAELAVLLNLKEAELEKFKNSPEKMEGWLNTGAYPVKSSPNQYEWAANTVVASAILNADATITKR